MANPQSEEQLLSQAWNLFAKDDYAGVLNICRSGYAHGVRSYDMVRLMLDSLNKLGKVQEQAEVTLKVLGENDYPPRSRPSSISGPDSSSCLKDDHKESAFHL